MNDAEREYASLITSMEREVLALKTAHQRPLGALNFFTKSESFDVNLTEQYGVYVANITLVVNIATPAVKPPIVQTGWDTPPGFLNINFTNFAVSSDYSTWTYTIQLLTTTAMASAPMKVSSLSSQPINSITWSYA